MGSSSVDAREDDGDIETGQAAKFITATKANNGDKDLTKRMAAQLVRQITLSRQMNLARKMTISRSRDMFYKSILKSRDLVSVPENIRSRDLVSIPEKDASIEPSKPEGVLGGIMSLLSNLPEWVKYLLAAIAFIAYPAYQRLRKAEDDIEDSVSTILQVVERVAEVTNKLAVDFAEALPHDGRLKDAVKTVGDIAHKVDKDAETAQAFIKMVDELGDDLDEYINPLIKAGDLFIKGKNEVKKELKQHKADQTELALDAKL